MLGDRPFPPDQERIPGAEMDLRPTPRKEGSAIQTIPLVRSTSLRPLIDYLDEIAVRPGPALEQARALLRDPGKLLPFPYAGSLFAEAQDTVASEAFGLRLGQATRVMKLGEWGTLIGQAVTVAGMLRAAMTTATRFNSGQRFTVSHHGSGVQLQLRMSPRLAEGRTTVSQFQLMLMLESIRIAAGPSWRPTEIHLEGAPPPHAEELAAYAAKSIHFGRPAPRWCFQPRYLRSATRRSRRSRRSPPARSPRPSSSAPAARSSNRC
jgi:hypothetical protein